LVVEKIVVVEEMSMEARVGEGDSIDEVRMCWKSERVAWERAWARAWEWRILDGEVETWWVMWKARRWKCWCWHDHVYWRR